MRAAYNKYCNSNNNYNSYYYTDKGYGTFNSDGEYAHANSNNNVDNFGDTEEYDGCCYYANGGYCCDNDDYDRYYNNYEGYLDEYVGPETGGYETNFPPNDEDYGPTSPQTAKTLENEMTEREEMAGIIERPGTQQQNDYRLANNRFAALLSEEEVDHGGVPTKTEVRATNWHVANNNDSKGENTISNIRARGTMMKDMEVDRSIGTTQSANTVRRRNCSNIMPTTRRRMTRGAAWNVIRERNWVQQTIADRDRRWCQQISKRN